ncbi:UvrD-helicase domain-containing protein [Bacillus sp. AFS002410]|uniref:UvrD-helicase domain-containing protein n=1 Tax=Bacillus sp. AFS002410 TaxID=2033481 RepID=UPI0015CF1BCC|nr:UvrD-helicase domain-containing protein [Bacillus sp. AFS002410]
MKLTKEQQIVVEKDEKIILVKAGAGTGKTEVLARKIIHLLENNINLSITDFTIITFTNKATDNLKSRIKDYLYSKWQGSLGEEKTRFRYELENINSANISTIHKFCKYILNQAGPISEPNYSYSSNYTVKNNVLDLTIKLSIEEFIQEKKVLNQSIVTFNFIQVYEFEKYIKQAFNQIKSKGYNLETVLEIFPPFLEDHRNKKEIREEFNLVLRKVNKKYYTLKNRSIDTEELLEYTFQLLKNNKWIVEELQDNIKYLFIDEFQDTSMYQTEIVRLICNSNEKSPNLFLVGDAKQSIYKFRGADQSSYNQTANWVGTIGSVLPLNTNFRSTPELIQLVNVIFQSIREKFPIISFKPENLRVPEIKFKPEIDMKSAYEWKLIDKEADYSDEVTKYVQKLVLEGENPGNIAILFRKNRSMLSYAKKLKELNIPYSLVGAGDFYVQKEVIDCYKVLKYYTSFKNEILELEVLESKFFNNNKDLLLSFVSELDYQSAIQELTPAQFLDMLFSISKINTIMKKQEYANLLKLKELVRKLNKQENIGVYACADWLSIQINSNIEETQATILENMYKKNEVELITIHKAKGLEFPIVILPELDQPYGKFIKNPSIIVDNKLGLGYYYRVYSGNYVEIKSSNYDSIIDQYETDLYSEELRVLYVALTRAEEKLVFFGRNSCPSQENCFQNWLDCVKPFN